MSEALIIDDNRTTADALSQMLKVLGFKARVAYGSGAAMDILAAGFTPKFICLDINMPGLNGIDLCRRMKADEELSRTRIVMLTGGAKPSDWQLALDAGADFYLTKPFRPGELLQVVEQMMRPTV